MHFAKESDRAWLDRVREAHDLSVMRNTDIVITQSGHVRVANGMNRKTALEVFRAPRPTEKGDRA